MIHPYNAILCSEKRVDIHYVYFNLKKKECVYTCINIKHICISNSGYFNGGNRYRGRRFFTIYSFYFFSFVSCGCIFYAKVNQIKKIFPLYMEFRVWGVGNYNWWHRRGNQEPGCDKWFGFKPVCNEEQLKYIRQEYDMRFPLGK